jgi:hypothetical protein
VEKNLSVSVKNEDSGKTTNKVMSRSFLPDYYLEMKWVLSRSFKVHAINAKDFEEALV